MSRLALLGGKPVFSRNHIWPKWPVIRRADEKRLLEVVRQGQLGLDAPVINQFAKAFAASLKTRYVLPVANGTAALELVVKALGIGPGDEVIVPAYTFVATATSVLQMGAAVVFADLDPETLEISAKDVARLINRKTRAIIPVHFGGNPCDMIALKKLVKNKKIAIVEDAAHAHGMLYRGKAAGSIGIAGCFSFQSSKNMTAGEGGALATNERRIYELAWSFHSFGRKIGHPWYEHNYLSANERITGMQSAILLGQLERLEAQTRLRLNNGRILDAGLRNLPGLKLQKNGDSHPKTRRAYHIYIFRYQPEATGVPKTRFLEALQAEGVPAFGGYPVPLQENPMFRNRCFWHSQYLGGGPRRPGEPDYTKVKTPVAKQLCAEAIWLSQNILLGSRSEMDGIIEAVAKVLSNCDALRRRKSRA